MDLFLVIQWVVRALLAIVFVGMGVLHLVPRVRNRMTAMIPPGLRGTGVLSPVSLVTVSGVAEIIGGLGLLVPVPEVRFAAGVWLIALLIAVFPANAYVARDPERFGRVAVPLVPRVIGQVVLGALVLVAAI
ncbi:MULTISPECIES: DoxX family protein [Microbacterium]|uniref:DoxX family protein n=1 Tax=Microbacterium TaxID=33882 RepID=UPI00217E2F5B|nr:MULTISPECIES: hypothetical protein [Microbacterium]UWF77944.1 DoxX family protein [Microbacterium neungamense]WCM56121.1 DoxX family protein [Microbacterium sp. EF45047]